MSDFDLNEIAIRTDDGNIRQADHSVSDGDVSVYFKNLKHHLIEKIKDADVVVGSVAWLTDYDILDELAKKKWVSIVVQKEDFLRIDVGGRATKPTLRRKYDCIRSGVRHEAGSFVGSLSSLGDMALAPVRCLGNHNKETSTYARAHNKFVVLCRNVETICEIDNSPIFDLKPYAVWTGSFNFSFTASLSFENAIYLTREKIVDAYFAEWGQILALSEPLDWKSEWVAPQWRIGS